MHFYPRLVTNILATVLFEPVQKTREIKMNKFYYNDDLVLFLGALPLGDSLESSNIGHKMLMKMGWRSGTGLGKEQQGRVDPVQAVSNTRRAGLSSESIKEAMSSGVSPQSAKKLLMDYINSGEDEPMVFSANFNKEERAVIHKAAQAVVYETGVNIDARSYGRGNERKLTVSFRYSPEDIFQHATHVGQKFGKLEVVSMGAFG